MSYPNVWENSDLIGVIVIPIKSDQILINNFNTEPAEFLYVVLAPHRHTHSLGSIHSDVYHLRLSDSPSFRTCSFCLMAG